MFKKKDHVTLEEAYNKVLMNEISSELPPEEEDDQEGGSDRDALIAAIKGASEVGDMESLKRNVAELNALLNGNMPSDDYEIEEPQSSGGNEGTGKYISNKEKSSQHKSDFLINRMNLKPGKDF
jgi:hypothetical protein